MKRYELVIIGAGSGGLTAAEYAAKLGAKVALIEKYKYLGGDCLNFGCVPSKALIHASKTYYKSVHSQHLGVELGASLNFEALKESIEDAKDRIRANHDNDEYFESLGVDVLHGEAKFHDQNTIIVDGEKIWAKKAIIATGSRPRIPDVPGINDVEIHTNETIFDIKELPKRMAVIGGGVIGCEIASAFNQLGTEIELFERYDHLSLRADEPVAEFIEGRFTSRGMKIHTKSSVDAFKKTKNGIEMSTTIHGKKKTVVVDAVFISIGRVSNLDLDLEKAGIEYTDRALTINKYGQTTNKHVWGVGDVTGTAGFTHVAAEQGFYAAVHALFGYRKQVSLQALPYVIFTSPEVAQVGATSEQLTEKGIKHVVRELDYSEIDRAMIERKGGMVRVMLDGRDRLLGATIAGSHASEQIGQFVVGMNLKLNMTNFSSTIQPYPTYAMASKLIAAEHLLDKAMRVKGARTFLNAVKALRK